MEADVRSYVNILKRRARWIQGVFLAVVVLTLAVMLMQSPVYRASALLEIRQGDGDVPTLAGLFDDAEPSEEYRRTHFELLRSETLAGRVIRDLALDTLEEFRGDGDRPFQSIVGGYLDRLMVAPVPDSRLVRLSFDAETPETAARVVNAIVEKYAELRTEARSGAAERLAVQVDSVRRSLEESERALREYTEANDLPYLVEEDITTEIGTRLSDLRGRLAEAQADRYEDESLYDIVVEEGRVDVVEDEAVRELEAQLSSLRSQYARLSSTFTDDYPATAEVLRQIESVRELISEEQERVAQRVGSDYRLALQREGKLSEAIEEQEEIASELGPQSGTHHLLRQAVLTNRALYTTLNERQREAETVAALGQTDFTVVDPAVPPTEPHSPIFAMTLGLALMLGLVLAVGTAFVKELLDDTVQSAEDLPIGMQVPVLGMIPAHGNPPMRPAHQASRRGGGGLLPWSNGQRASGSGKKAAKDDRWLRLDALEKGDAEGNAVADAFAALRTAVLFKEDGPLPSSILVSSCRAGEGKTTISVNLAMSLARLGNRVLLVDGDLRRPSIHRALGVRASPGLLDTLRTDVDWKTLVRFDVVEGLDVLTSGGSTSHAADLLAGDRMNVLLQESEARYDFVLVDAPALFINATDARLLSRQVDGVLVVIRSQSTPRALVDRIPRDVPNLMGVVVNDLSKTSLPDYFGDYFTEYGSAEGAGASSSKPSRSGRSANVAAHVARAGHTEPERA